MASTVAVVLALAVSNLPDIDTRGSWPISCGRLAHVLFLALLLHAGKSCIKRSLFLVISVLWSVIQLRQQAKSGITVGFSDSGTINSRILVLSFLFRMP